MADKKTPITKALQRILQQRRPTIDQAIGDTLRVSEKHEVCRPDNWRWKVVCRAAMISRIESAQVSPSISTMTSLSDALEVPVISLFRDTAPPESTIRW